MSARTRADDRDVREALREVRLYGSFGLVAAVVGTVSETRLEEIDNGADMTDAERIYLAAHLVEP
jgi:hypothetical protein